MRIILSICLMCSMPCLAQIKSRTILIGVNPFSVAESAGSLGPAVSYRVSSRFELWTEGAYIFRNNYLPDRFTGITGFRFLFQPRYYMGDQLKFFISPEFRLKVYRFGNMLNLTNNTDTLHNVALTEKQTLLGGALVLGRRFTLNKKKTFFLEVTMGIGAKQRYIKYQNIPAGYKSLYERAPDSGLSPDYESARGTVYFPDAIRLMWEIK